jgi:hypothetical protein
VTPTDIREWFHCSSAVLDATERIPHPFPQSLR